MSCRLASHPAPAFHDGADALQAGEVFERVALDHEQVRALACRHHPAVGELQRAAGTQFDPSLVDPLIETIVAKDRPPLRLVPALR